MRLIELLAQWEMDEKKEDELRMLLWEIGANCKESNQGDGK
jgi:hypothetical protein